MAMVDVDGSSLLVDSQPNSTGLVWRLVNWVNSGNGFGRYDSTLKIVEVLLLLLLKSSPEQFSTTLPQTWHFPDTSVFWSIPWHYHDSCKIVLSVLWRCWLGGRKGIQPVKKTEWWGASLVISLEWGADLHTAQLMPLPVTASCFSKIRMVLPFWYRLTWVVPEKGPLNGCKRTYRDSCKIHGRFLRLVVILSLIHVTTAT